LETNLQKLKREKSQLQQEKDSSENESKQITSKIENNERLIESLNDSITNFQEVDTKSLVQDFQKKITEKQEELKVLQESKQEVEGRIEKNNYWILTFTRFKTHLSNKVIKVIECFINEYLQRMSVDIRVSIDG